MGVALLRSILQSDAVDTADVAYVTGSTIRSVQRWRSHGVMPRPQAIERLVELRAVLDAAAMVYRPDGARIWLRSPVPMLGYDKPLDLIRGGAFKRVAACLDALAEGVVV